MSDSTVTDSNAVTEYEKGSVARSFGKAAGYYERNAGLQKEVARRLVASLEPWRGALPAGPVLELGCGTGFVTEGLLELLPDRAMEITDLSPEMVAFCRNKFEGSHDRLAFRTLDAERLDAAPETYALTVSGFTAQWFRHPAVALGRCLEATRPGGLLLASFPGNESFPEWKEACRELGLPFTGNALPDTEEMVVKLSGGPVQVDYYEDTLTQTFESAAGFFRHMKRIGAGTRRQGRPLRPKEMRRLIRYWDRKAGGAVTVSYHIVFVAVKRNYDS